MNSIILFLKQNSTIIIVALFALVAIIYAISSLFSSKHPRKKEKEEKVIDDSDSQTANQKPMPLRFSPKAENQQKEFFKSEIPYLDILDLSDLEVEERFFQSFIQCKDASVLCVFRLDPRDSRMDEFELDARQGKLAIMLSKIFDSKYSLTVDFSRRLSTPQYINLSDDMEEGSAKEVEKLRKRSFSSEINFFKNEIFLTVRRKPNAINFKTFTDTAARDFIFVLNQVENSLNAADINTSILEGNELTQYLWNCVTDDAQISFHIPSNKTLDEAITDQLSYLRLNSVPFEVNERIIQTITIPSLSNMTPPDMISCLKYVPYECRMMINYDCLSTEENSGKFESKRKSFSRNKIKGGAAAAAAFSGNTENFSQDDMDISQTIGQKEVEEAIEYCTENNYAGGYITATVILSAVQGEELFLDEISRNVQRTLMQAGFNTKKEMLDNPLAFFASYPARKEEHLPLLAHAGNMSCLFPVSAYNKNKVSKNLTEITGSEVPLLYGKHFDDSLYWFSPSGPEGQKGHTLLTAPSGGGKSVLLALMAAQWLKYPDSQVVFIDMDLSSLNLTQHNNGKVFFPCMDDTTFSPFKGGKDDLSIILQFCQAIATANNREFTPEMQSVCTDAVNHLSDTPTLDEFYGLVKGRGSKFEEILEPYMTGDNIFRSKDDSFTSLPRISLIEMSELLRHNGKRITTPALIYLFFKLEKLFDGLHPVLLVLDEAWKFLKDDVFADIIADWLKTLRKKRVYVIIATQEIEDITSSPVAQVILNNCETRIFLANSRARDPINRINYAKLGMQDKDIDVIADMPRYSSLISQNEILSAVNFMITPKELNLLVTTADMKAEFIYKIQHKGE